MLIEFQKYKKKLTVSTCPASCYNCYLYNAGFCTPQEDAVCPDYFTTFAPFAFIKVAGKSLKVKPEAIMKHRGKLYFKVEILPFKPKKYRPAKYESQNHRKHKGID